MKSKGSDTVTMYASSGQTHIHHDGVQYMVDGNGEVEVPVAAVEVLKGHGLTTEKPEETTEYAGDKKNGKKSK